MPLVRQELTSRIGLVHLDQSRDDGESMCRSSRHALEGKQNTLSRETHCLQMSQFGVADSINIFMKKRNINT